jgi:hypothetical protein
MASKIADAVIEGRQAIAKEAGAAAEAAKAAGAVQATELPVEAVEEAAADIDASED